MNDIFDVFLSYNSEEKPAVRELAEALRARGLKVWLDEWELVPGRSWQKALEEIIETTRSAAVLVGKDGIGPWQDVEIQACLVEFVKRRQPVIPVLLPGAQAKPRLPLFLSQSTWVDLRSGLTEEGLDRLRWGVTGNRPDRLKLPSIPTEAPEAEVAAAEVQLASGRMKVAPPVVQAVQAPEKSLASFRRERGEPTQFGEDAKERLGWERGLLRSTWLKAGLTAGTVVLSVQAILANWKGANEAWQLLPAAVALCLLVFVWVLVHNGAATDDKERKDYLDRLTKEVNYQFQASFSPARYIELRLNKKAVHYPYQLDDSSATFDDVFTRLDRRLLLLGGPGSGKSTTLLYAAKLLLEESGDSTKPIPVYLKLASDRDPETPPRFSWLRRFSPQELSFDQRLIEELLRLPVRLRRATAARWIEEGRIALLLDGLDELEESRAARLIESFSRSSLHHRPDLTVVVSSRDGRLTREQEKSLGLNGIVVLQPFDGEQINSFLVAADARPLKDVLANDPELSELAQTPLNLSMMTRAYEGDAPESANLKLTDRRRRLFDNYVNQMIERAPLRNKGQEFQQKPDKKEYCPKEARLLRYLGWLAERLSERAQSSFAADDLPGLLAKEKAASAPKAEDFWTELSAAQFFQALVLSAAVSGLWAMNATTTISPWFVMIAGPVSFLFCHGGEWLELRWIMVGREV